MRFSILLALLVIGLSAGSSFSQLGHPVFKLLPEDGQVNGEFGESVAFDGDYAVVGVPLYDCGAGTDCGAAYVYRFDGQRWRHVVRLTHPLPAADDRFGASVGIFKDLIVVGAPKEDDARTDAGSAFVYRLKGEIWQLEQRLFAADAAAGDWFGYAVSAANDRIAVGAPIADPRGLNSGAVYLFRRRDGQWASEQKLIASDGTSNDQFGSSLDLARDQLVVGAQLDNQRGASAGSAYVFRFEGTRWVEEQKLLGLDTAAGDWFGMAVAISHAFVIVGARYDDDLGSNSGSAYVFGRRNGGWEQMQKLLASEGRAVDRFGETVGMRGSWAVFGAPGDDDRGSGAGSVYVFHFSGRSWREVDELYAPDALPEDRLGISIALNERGIVSGAFRDDDGGFNSGSAYVFSGRAVSFTLRDYAVLQNCFLESVGSGPSCAAVDSTESGYVDLSDYRDFYVGFVGPE